MARPAVPIFREFFDTLLAASHLVGCSGIKLTSGQTPKDFMLNISTYMNFKRIIAHFHLNMIPIVLHFIRILIMPIFLKPDLSPDHSLPD